MSDDSAATKPNQYIAFAPVRAFAVDAFRRLAERIGGSDQEINRMEYVSINVGDLDFQPVYAARLLIGTDSGDVRPALEAFLWAVKPADAVIRRFQLEINACDETGRRGLGSYNFRPDEITSANVIFDAALDLIKTHAPKLPPA